ncbi:homeobox protein not2-like [Conger conger]|uniref:homeobox protein not2-like n=1 Tax=Conger conger TaxID=82655 RepID=UPI002A5A03D7|nr:homeobox protein not2-like [Conger conger]
MTSMDTTFSYGASYASPIQYLCGERNGAPGLPTKATETKPKCSFSIEAILSTSPRESSQLKMAMHQGLTHPTPFAPHPWLPSGYSTPGSPYTYHYTSYHPNEIQNHNGFTGPCDKLMSRRSYVRRTCRRIRTIFTDEQLMKLEEVFSKQRYMTGTEKVLLASALRLSETQVKVWFQNRRTRWRKTQEDKTSNQLSSPRQDEFISVDEEDSWSP